MELWESAFDVLLIGFAINCALLIFFLVVTGAMLFMGIRMKETMFQPVVRQLVQVRRRLKMDAYSLNEFLQVCSVLGITKQEVVDAYTNMHRDRRATGERWLFDSDKSPRERNRRKMAVFTSFAANSQFTQGRLGYRMHHLLHRPVGYQHRYAPEAFTMFDISYMINTGKDDTPKT